MIQRYPGEPEWRVWWRRAFAAALGFVLVAGLYLSFRPGGFDEQEELAGDQATSSPTPAAGPTAAPTPVAEDPSEAPADEALSQEEIDELIAAARAPEETSVQVLDAGGGSDATDDAAETLAELGYDVVAINPSRTEYDVTTVLFTDGNDAEAQALSARDQRFAETGPNERLSDGVDLHVVVGPDWSN